MDSYRHGGHTPEEVFQFASYLADEADATQAQRDLGVRTTAGLNLGRRRRGLLRGLLGGR